MKTEILKISPPRNGMLCNMGSGFLKIKYPKEADIHLIELRDGTPVDSIDLKEGVILHLDGEGLPLEIELLDASKLAAKDEISFSRPMGIQR